LQWSDLIDDLCVGFDGPAIWGGEQKDPPWVLALVAPSAELLKIPEDRRSTEVLADMRRLADAKGMQPHEHPLRVLFVDEAFSQANGCRNSNEKLLWTKVEELHAARIIAEYKEPLTIYEQKVLDDAGGH
jgi:hypothetical protein